MKLIKPLFFVLLASSLMLGQNSASTAGPATDQPQISDQIKALQDSITRQQKQIEDLQKKIAEQQQKAAATPQLMNASLTTNAPAAEVQSDKAEVKESPLSVRIGGTEWTPGGFMDFQNIFRSTNTGSVISTGFNAIPFSNVPAGQLTEFRSSGQYSRWNLKMTGKYGDTNLTGYVEGDFNGNDAANVFVTTNPHTLRLRLYYLNAKHGIWEFTAGQAWSLITPNRTGVSPMPSDLATTQSTDGNIHVGVNYGRDGQFRVAVHPNDHFSWAVSIENPEQITNGEVILPTGFAGQLGTQPDGVATAGVPNAFPDVMTKLAYDTKMGARAFHIEAGGLMTSAKLTVQPTPVVAGSAFNKPSKMGSGFMGGLNFELFKNFRVLGYGAYGAGIGRYFIGFGPQFVVVPVNAAGATCVNGAGCSIDISMVHAADGYGGVETQLGKKTQLAAYYGGIYYQRNSFADITSAAATKPIIGFGGTGSANTNNRAIQEGSFVITQTLWKHPQYGALLLINDASYSTRAPWFVNKNATTGALLSPKNAHMIMDSLDLRYVLP